MRLFNAGLAVLLSLGCSHCGSSTTPEAATSNGGHAGVAGSSVSQAGSMSDAGASGAVSSAGSTNSGGSGGIASGGAGASGASGSAGAAGASGSAGATASDPCTDRTICEEFEKMTLGSEPQTPFSIHKSKGTVTVDATHVHSGKQALKVSITATAADDTYRQAMLAVTGAPLLPLTNNSLYGRFMIYTDRIPDKTVHWTIAHGDGPYQTTTATYNYGGMGGLMANYYRDTPSNATDCWQSNQQLFPTGKWTCVGFHFDGQQNKMQFSIDGADITDVDVDGNTKTDQTCTIPGVDGKWYAPTPFKNISVGWESYQHDTLGAHDAWLDDVILDESPIACPAN
jgi:hypothetical protein